MNRVYQFGPFQLDRHSGSVWHGSTEIHLTAKAYATLLLLLENPGSLITKETLLEKVWPEGFIEPANLTQTIYVLRKTLCRGDDNKSYIETIPGRGYRFVAPVLVVDGATPASAQAAVAALRGPRSRHPVIWPAAALLLALMVLSLHSSAPSGAKRLSISAEAQRYYILGRHYWSERTNAGLVEGLRYFQAALHKSRNYAQAYSGIADSYSAIGYYSNPGPERRRYYALAEKAAREGIAIDPSCAEAHASLAFVFNVEDKSLDEASRQFQESIALNPDYATAREWYSWLLYSRGKTAEALAQMDKARDLDPLSPIINYALGYQLYYMRNFKDSSAQWRQAMKIAPDDAPSYYGAGLADEQLGKTAVAEREFRKALALSPKDPDIMAALAHVYATTRRAHDAQQLLKRITGINPAPAYSIAVVDEALGQQGLALKWLAIAKANKDPSLQVFDMDPRFDKLRQRHPSHSWNA